MFSKRWSWLLLLLFLFALLVRILPGPRTIDDAYITFRYSRNLLAGEGFVYNSGERVLGTTTPLYTFLLTGLGFFFGGVNAPFPWLALVLNAFADGISAVFLVLIGHKLGSRLAGWGAGLAWAIAPFSVTFAIGGMETSVYVLTVLVIFWAYLRGRYKLASVFAMLSLLTRPDALILILPLAVDRIFLSHRRGELHPDIKEALLFLVPLGFWISFAWLYFGNPLPQSLFAKSEAYLLPPFAALVRLLQHYATPFQGHLSFGLGWIRVGFVLFPFLALAGSFVAIRKEAASLPFLVFPWFYLAAFAIGNPLIFRWYLTPILPFYFLLILIGTEKLIRQLIFWLGRRRKFPVWLNTSILASAILLGPFLLLLKDWQVQPIHGPQRPAPEMAFIELELLYEIVADELQESLTNDNAAKTLAAADVGVLGFFTNARILDLIGINSPQALDYYPSSESDSQDFIFTAPTELVLDHQPDFVVILEIYGRQTLLKNSDFLESYRLRQELPTDIYGSNGMLIFELK